MCKHCIFRTWLTVNMQYNATYNIVQIHTRWPVFSGPNAATVQFKSSWRNPYWLLTVGCTFLCLMNMSPKVRSMLIKDFYTSFCYHQDYYEVTPGLGHSSSSGGSSSTGRSFAHSAAHEARTKCTGAIDGCHTGIKVINTPDAQTSFSLSLHPPGYFTNEVVASPSCTDPLTLLL